MHRERRSAPVDAGRLAAPLLAAVTLVTVPCRAAMPLGLPQGGTIAFLGDSITWQNHYLAWIELRARQTGRKDLTFVNLGVRGDTAGRVRRRLERDLLPRMPALTFIMLGINDGGLAGLNGRLLDRYAREMSHLVAEVKARTEAPVVLLSPTPVDPKAPGNADYNEMLRSMTQRLAGVAAQHRVRMIDVFAPLLNAVSQSDDVGVLLMADALHPNEAGHLVVAATILEALEAMGSGNGPQGAAILVSAALCAGGSETVSLDFGERDRWFPPAYARVLESTGGTGFGVRRVSLAGERCALWLRVPGSVLSVGEQVRHIDLPALAPEPPRAEFVRAQELIRARWQRTYALWDPEGRGALRALADVGGTARNGERDLLVWLQEDLAKLRSELDALDLVGSAAAVKPRGLLSGRPISR